MEEKDKARRIHKEDTKIRIHVPGVYDPAHLPSRGCSPAQLLRLQWWEGLSWLKKHEADWPTESSEENEDVVVCGRNKAKAVILLASTVAPWYVAKKACYMKNLKVMA